MNAIWTIPERSKSECSSSYRLPSILTHALAMLVWGLGLPPLFWHRWPVLSRVYMAYSLLLVATPVLSQLALGECFLTTLARELSDESTNAVLRYRTSFTVRLVETVAGLRPSERTAVRLWELAIFVTSSGMLFYMGRPPSGASGLRRDAAEHH